VSSSEIISKFRAIEKDKFYALIKKRGVDIIINPLKENILELDDVNAISSMYDVETVGSKQYEPTKKTFDTDIASRMVTVEGSEPEWKKLANDEYSRTSNNDDTDDYTQTNSNTTYAIILYEYALRVGTKIRLKADENVKYTISKAYKKRATTNLFRYRLVRD